MEKEIRSHALGLRRVNTTCGIFDEQFGKTWLPIFIQDSEFYPARRLAVKEQADFIAKAKILRALTSVEAEGCITFSGIAAVEQDDAIFDIQAAEVGFHWRCVEHFSIQPACRERRFTGILWFRAGHDWRRSLHIGLPGLRTVCCKLGRDTRFIIHPHQILTPARFIEHWFRRARNDFDSLLGRDGDVEQHAGIKHGLCFGNRCRIVIANAGFQCREFFGTEG